MRGEHLAGTNPEALRGHIDCRKPRVRPLLWEDGGGKAPALPDCILRAAHATFRGCHTAGDVYFFTFQYASRVTAPRSVRSLPAMAMTCPLASFSKPSGSPL